MLAQGEAPEREIILLVGTQQNQGQASTLGSGLLALPTFWASAADACPKLQPEPCFLDLDYPRRSGGLWGGPSTGKMVPRPAAPLRDTDCGGAHFQGPSET